MVYCEIILMVYVFNGEGEGKIMLNLFFCFFFNKKIVCLKLKLYRLLIYNIVFFVFECLVRDWLELYDEKLKNLILNSCIKEYYNELFF